MLSWNQSVFTACTIRPNLGNNHRTTLQAAIPAIAGNAIRDSVTSNALDSDVHTKRLHDVLAAGTSECAER